MEFISYTDKGAPVMTIVDGVMTVTYSLGDRGRFMTENFIASAGEEHNLTGEYRLTLGATGLPAVVCWKDVGVYQLLTTIREQALIVADDEFIPFELAFTTPPGIGSFRIELRSWAGKGTVEWRNVELDAAPVEPEPEPEPVPQIEWVGGMMGRGMWAHRVNLPEEEVDWPCYQLVGVEWGGNLYFTKVVPEEIVDPPME